MHGTITSGGEVTDVSAHGLSLRVDDERLTLTFSDFPWFQRATASQLNDVQRPSSDHLYWPQLDIDLALESIRKPENFPLVSRA